MVHLDKDVAKFFYEREMYSTNALTDILIKNNISVEHMQEKVHIALSLIDDLCHEIIYHKHSGVDYEVMKDEVAQLIVGLLRN